MLDARVVKRESRITEKMPRWGVVSRSDGAEHGSANRPRGVGFGLFVALGLCR